MTLSAGVERQTSRTRRLKLASMLSITYRVVSIGTSFYLVPFLTQRMGVSRYGLWLTISSLSAWLTLTDLGLGSALVNDLSAAVAKCDREQEARIIAKHLLPISFLVLSVSLVFFIIFPFVPWRKVVAVSDDINN